MPISVPKTKRITVCILRRTLPMSTPPTVFRAGRKRLPVKPSTSLTSSGARALRKPKKISPRSKTISDRRKRTYRKSRLNGLCSGFAVQPTLRKNPLRRWNTAARPLSKRRNPRARLLLRPQRVRSKPRRKPLRRPSAPQKRRLRRHSRQRKRRRTVYKRLFCKHGLLVQVRAACLARAGCDL